MDEQKPKSSWDDLIKELGAAPPPDALERKRPAIETTFEPPREVNLQAVKPKPGDWNALASELGVEVKDEPPRKPVAPAPHSGPSSNALEASFAEIEPMESDFEDVVEDEIADIDFEDDDDEDEEEEEEFPRAKPRAADPSTLAGEAARNAFESLFEAGSFSALPPLKKPEPREAPRQRGGPQWRELDEPRGGDRQEVDEEIEFEEVNELEGEGGEGEGAAQEDRDAPRRRRRRRRGRGREGDRAERGERPAPRGGEAGDELAESTDREESDEESEGVEGEAEGGELGERPVRRRRRRRRRGKGEAGDERPARAAANGESAARGEDEDDEEDHEEDASGGEDEDDGDDSPRESHKNIPTWSDAISVMVETNLQSRKTSPSRPSGPRERGRGGRGRGRGGSGGGRRGKA